MPANATPLPETHRAINPVDQCGTCHGEQPPRPRFRFAAPLLVAVSCFSLTGAAIGWQAMEPACETSYRSQVGSAATAEGLIEFCASQRVSDEELAANS